MEASIYIDVVFLFEWMMNLFLLWAAGRFSGFSAKKWRLVLGALLSAFCHCLLLVFGQLAMGGAVLSSLLLLLGISTAYLPKKPKNILRLFLSAWVASFLMGGGLSVLFTLTQAQTLLGAGLIMGVHFFPWQSLLWGIAISYLLLKWAGKWIEAHVVRRREYCTVYLRKNGRWTEGWTLIDTGNGLKREGRGVIVMEMATVLSLFPKEEQEGIMEGQRTGLTPMYYTSLGNPDGALWGFLAEECRLAYGEKMIRYENLYVGISFELFTGAYEGLTPPCLLEEEEK